MPHYPLADFLGAHPGLPGGMEAGLAARILASFDIAPKGLTAAIAAHHHDLGAPALEGKLRELYGPLFAEAAAKSPTAEPAGE